MGIYRTHLNSIIKIMASLIRNDVQIRTEEEMWWDELVEQIWAGNVIPVVGENLVVSETTIIKEIIEYLSIKKKLKSIPQSFSELYYDKQITDYQRNVIYEEVSSLIEKNQSEFRPTDILREFLSIEQFPFVITTSVDYTVEETMRDIWEKGRGRELKTLVFTNDAMNNGDIKKDSDIKNPTIYYMFGKANNKRPHSFVLTEEDLLSFCQSWLSENHPKLLSKVIGNKYLLFFGVNYPDWLIRFVWFSMRNNLSNSGMLVDKREFEDSLQHFFQRVSIRSQSTPDVVVAEIKERLAIKKAEYEKNMFESVPTGMDFFISYSRRDLKWADTLYRALTNMGYKVWFDKKDIPTGDDWAPAVRKGIRTARHVIILISENVALESEDESHVYRGEWEIALANRLVDKKYIIPLCLGNTDLYKDERLNLPIELQRIQSFIWEDKDKVDNVILELTK